MALTTFQLVEGGTRRVAASVDGARARLVGTTGRVLDLAHLAMERGSSLAGAVAEIGLGDEVDIDAALADGRVLPPIDHPDPARLLLTGTGLTHLGSAAGRDAMHKAAASGHPTDSMRMFQLGVDGGKPAPGTVGAQPEWFYKGDGRSLVPPGGALRMPPFAGDGGEEPEIAGLYVIGPDGTPHRLGFAIGNEFSDHVTERGNYLWLAHSKLRAASLGPELVTGPLPAHVEGFSRIERDGAVLWEKPFVSGEANMSHSIANLEHHHFKYDLFRRAGDVHVHFFGTATLSCADGIETRDGDVFAIRAGPFRYELRNTLRRGSVGAPVTVRAL